MREVRFSLSISAGELLRYYRGDARAVVAVTDEGVRVQFPAAALRPFVTVEGVHGRFALAFDAQNRMTGLRRL
ncbi:MAG: DUF2835 domain-containing protein [Pseudomonadota bacterium]